MIYLLSDTLERQIHPPEGSCAQSIHESAHFQTEFQIFMTSYDTMLLNKNECKHKEFLHANSIPHDRMAMEVLATLWCQCCGVKFYSAIKSRGWLCKDMSLRRWPHNPYDRNCVEVIRSEGGTKLGHVDRAAAEWLSPLLKGPFKMTG